MNLVPRRSIFSYNLELLQNLFSHSHVIRLTLQQVLTSARAVYECKRYDQFHFSCSRFNKTALLFFHFCLIAAYLCDSPTLKNNTSPLTECFCIYLICLPILRTDQTNDAKVYSVLARYFFEVKRNAFQYIRCKLPTMVFGGFI